MTLKQHAIYDSGLDVYRNRREFHAHTTKQSSIHFRKNALDRQTVSNYQNEYNRVRGELSNTVLSNGLTKRRLEERQAELLKLGASAVNSIV